MLSAGVLVNKAAVLSAGVSVVDVALVPAFASVMDVAVISASGYQWSTLARLVLVPLY